MSQLAISASFEYLIYVPTVIINIIFHCGDRFSKIETIIYNYLLLFYCHLKKLKVLFLQSAKRLASDLTNISRSWLAEVVDHISKPTRELIWRWLKGGWSRNKVLNLLSVFY